MPVTNRILTLSPPKKGERVEALSFACVLQNLDSFRQDQLAVNPHKHAETDLPLCGIQFDQTLNTDRLPVRDPVVREITECDRFLARTKFRHEAGLGNRTTEQTVGLTSLQTRLPDVLIVCVFQFPDRQNS